MKSSLMIIAEAGVNHNGSLEQAKSLVDCAADAGADAVKFQTFKADKLVSAAAPRAGYQIRNAGGSETQREMIAKLELDEPAHAVLIDHCAKRGIEFLSTPFDLDSLQLLARKFGLSRIKISSGDISNGMLLLEAARTGKPVILSTGMSTLADIEAALGVLAFGYLHPGGVPSSAAFEIAYASAHGQSTLREKVTLLHCTTEYPAPLAEVNLNAMATLKHAFGLAVGYSDHTSGTTIPVAAAALGAIVIEKHFTLDRALPGPDHKASLEPGELGDMVRAIREVGLALGSSVKQPAPSELANRLVARKSLVAARDIHVGEAFTPENLAIKRPGGGMSPMRYWDWLGKAARRDYRADEQVEP